VVRVNQSKWIEDYEKQIAHAERLRADPRVQELPETHAMLGKMIEQMHKSLASERAIELNVIRMCWFVLVASLIVLLLQVGFAIWNAVDGRWIPAITAFVMATVATASAGFMVIILRRRYGALGGRANADRNNE
jgi:hypothetical protein